MNKEPFLLLPAIDLRGGRAVRLRQGEAHRETRYSDDPVQVARQFAEAGARALHVVDLDGAFSGSPIHLPLVARICRVAGIPVRLGGGLRRSEDIEAAFSSGVSVAILGTSAIEDPSSVEQALARFGKRLAVSLDVRGDSVRTRGWVEQSAFTPIQAATRLAKTGLEDLIVTAVARDGELSGPDLGLLRRAATAFGRPVIAAGGVAAVKDLEVLEAEPAVRGAVVGKAFYEGTLTLSVFGRAGSDEG
ncbi:MAG TPA: 1-(5-phosphoribosyl)-5-[(5-phosphoribosylamino)methylideneamino]imidazole-4-carboxamide isomerase [Thermoanaerobaculia bacterium]|nr:1-(5-phosphoribosyl)-5-[(5-phosphoribosylamino)methylideneamino]imidazole-4-carboxamide isomerase [Thermoanaerobaculia bacterium]